MNPMPALIPMLKEIRLSGILDSLESRNRQAIEDKLAYTDFLALLLQDEVARRSHKKLAVRLRRANFRNQKTLEDFDFAFNPSVNRALILDLATGRYIEEKVPVLIAGPTGTGKSHIAQALGHSAIRQGYDVLFTTQSKLLGLLQAARATNTLDRRFQSLAQIDLLIIDDFGLKPIRSPQDEDKGRVKMSNDKKHITKVRIILSVILLAIIVAAAVTGYRYYRANRWITAQDSPEDWVAVEGQLAEKNSPPCPQMRLKQGKVKFLPDTAGKSEKLLGYKLAVAAEMGKTERDVSKYSPYLYQARFRFTLVDKDGFPLQVVEGPKDFEIFEISKSRSYQNVCATPVGDSTAERTNSVYVTYVLSATGPHP